ncbi:hypothetical protein EK21DRAFT_106670 [Setomelanomma holmii]|uniref:Uncharacterized protein n=1 Tax=Setomelanomma holmii TaxID=210430 RepID=A0A9P4HK39_9PLEO|nr:hypothetical protein EK21DRAFT_106670 [Setomelanomma holmii]
MSSTKFTKYFEGGDVGYLNTLINQIKKDIPTPQRWTHVDLIRLLNMIAANGGQPARSAEDILNPTTSKDVIQTLHNLSGSNEVGLALTMGRGRRFVRTLKGRLGLVPAVGSKAGNGANQGLAIVILHGSIMPLVLKSADKSKNE